MIGEDPAKVTRRSLMMKAKPSRYLVPVVLLALLLVGMTIGTACHHHSESCDSNCSICHLGHQPMDRPMASSQVLTLVPLAPSSDGREIQLVSSPVFHRVPARAPPTA